ncbi:hypothetical protein MMASJCM_3482 [Mycobacteroides abscessus subsp. massiliense CCUG 48898 = JCM 15300]|nr:hypothetical protein MMASJCM_3482 [Mycobacteroides abscessus subsp. massiliense CCUG 48898 = JCM 15300]
MKPSALDEGKRKTIQRILRCAAIRVQADALADHHDSSRLARLGVCEASIGCRTERYKWAAAVRGLLAERCFAIRRCGGGILLWCIDWSAFHRL